MNTFLKLCEEFNFPISEEKTFWVSQCLMFLGLLIDMVHRYVSIPVDKVTHTTELIQQILSKRKTTVKELQKLCGFLNFLCRCIIPGRAFTRRIYAKFNSSMKPHYHIDINRELRQDLLTWLQFLKEPSVYCRPFLDFSEIISETDIDLYTDASGVVGCSGIRECEDFFKQIWNKQFIITYRPSIEFLELYAVAVAVILWIKKYQNKRICLFADNESVMNMINKTTSGCRNCMVLIRMIVLECMSWNVHLFAKHVRTKENSFTDALSRNQMQRFWYLAKK